MPSAQQREVEESVTAKQQPDLSALLIAIRASSIGNLNRFIVAEAFSSLKVNKREASTFCEPGALPFRSRRVKVES